MTTPRTTTNQAGRCLRLSLVRWRTYLQLLHALDERPGMRLTYDRGELEIASPLREYDGDRPFLGRLVFVLTEVLGLPLKRGGVEVMRSSLDRMSIYAKLGVPEVWRLDGDTLTFHVLGGDGKYTEATASLSFPMVTPADLMGFLQQARQAGDESPIVRQFSAWVRQRQSAPPANPTPNP
ncbi:MAG: Uma2 family endonuclease [Gemmataceae bacterium]|nr:Uma2 family endonuclease [Gemmataceae bacterium]